VFIDCDSKLSQRREGLSISGGLRVRFGRTASPSPA
jgi:hypothetical protein